MRWLWSSSGGSEGGEGEVSPSRSPQSRSSLAAEGAERSPSSGLGECLICGIPQIIRAAGNVGQGQHVPSPAPLLVLQEAAKVAPGKETWGLHCGRETPASHHRPAP